MCAKKGGGYMSHTIRWATISDVLQIAEIYVTSLKHSFNGIFSEGYLSKLTPESKYQQWKRNIENPNNLVLVLENDQEIIGVIVGASVNKHRETNNIGNLLAVYIKSEYKGMGYGRKLVEALFNEFKKQDIKKCVATVFKSNKDKGFYEHVGGVLVEERPVDEAHVISVFIYRWDSI